MSGVRANNRVYIAAAIAEFGLENEAQLARKIGWSPFRLSAVKVDNRLSIAFVDAVWARLSDTQVFKGRGIFSFHGQVRIMENYMCVPEDMLPAGKWV